MRMVNGTHGCGGRSGVGKMFCAVFLLLIVFESVECGGGVLNLHHKFGGNFHKSEHRLSDYLRHDRSRHGRILENVDIPMGGTADPAVAGLYYAELGIGTPVQKYYAQIDTGSDLFWLNCVPCVKCPRHSGLGVELKLYDMQKSSTSSTVKCGQSFCDVATQYQDLNCNSGEPCPYGVQYGDGSTTTGYYVKDNLQFNEVTGNFKTQPGNTSVYFGCGSYQTGELQSADQALDGILGLGQANTSLITQLASSGKTPNVFAHCLDGEVGGGILVIGHIVDRKLKMTPLVPDMSHYNVNLEGVDIDGAPLPVDKSVYKTTTKQGTIIDSGTTLAYISEAYYKPLITAIMAAEPGIEYEMRQGAYCFLYDGSVDQAFPTVTFNFEGPVSMKIFPHDYLLLDSDNAWCIGWMDSATNSDDNKYMTILGDLVLKNRLVVYDLEKQAIGWDDYNCSSSVTLKDSKTGNEAVAAHHLSNGTTFRISKFFVFFVSFFTAILLHFRN